jgi:4-diphosphocytidyl-2C-methyl-D-erythritol kinase
VAEYYKRLADLVPAGQLMSGSGSALFALCRSSGETERIAAALRDSVRDSAAGDEYRVFAVRGCV